MMALSLPAAEKSSPSTSSRPVSDDFSGSIYNALGIKEELATSQYDLHKEQTDSVTKANSVVELAPLSSETAAFTPFDTLATRNESMISNDSSKDINQKYKPMPNPVYNSNGSILVPKDILPFSKNEMNHAAPETVPNMKPVVGVRTSSLLLSQKPTSSQNGSITSSLNRELINKNDDDDYEENEDEKEYHNRMPRPPPKDEKWVISSIRRPQQLPVRTMNARMFDGTTSSRNSMASPTPRSATAANIVSSTEHSPAADLSASSAAETEHIEDDIHRHPKPHKPSIPLTIDIPNSVKPTPDVAQNAAQQVIAEGRRQSQMSPVQQNMDLHHQPQLQQVQPIDRNVLRGYINNQQNGMEEGGIRPAPWQEEFNADDHHVMRAPMHHNGSYYGNGHASYQPGMPGVRSSSIKLSEQQQLQHQQQQQQQMLQQQQQ